VSGAEGGRGERSPVNEIDEERGRAGERRERVDE